MKTRQLFMTMVLMLISQWAAAQYWESGTSKTAKFYNYTSGKTHYSQTEVWYTINLEEDGEAQFVAEPIGAVSVDGVSVYYYDGDGEARYRSGGSENYTVVDLAKGTYRIRVNGHPTDNKGYGGNFRVTYVYTQATLADDPQPNEEWTESSLVQSGTELQGHLGYHYGNNDTDTRDWYRIVVPDEGIITFEAHTETTLRLGNLELYTLKDDGTSVQYRCGKDMDGYNNDTTIVYTIPDVAPGTYYVKQSRYGGYGSYKLKYTFTASDYAQDGLTNNSWDTAAGMSLDSENQGRLGFFYRSNETDTQDWFRIEVKEEGKLTFITKSETTLRLGNLELYVPNADGTGVLYRSGKDMDGYSKDTTIVYELPDVAESVYYVRQSRYGGYGGYSLSCYFSSHADEADPEPNDTWEQAVALKSGPAVSGQLGYQSKNDLDTQDWYKIVVPDEGTITFSTNTETTLRLGNLELNTLNADGTGVKYRNGKDMDGYNKDTTIVYHIPDVSKGTYYVRVSRYLGYGTYRLQYVYTPNSRKTDPEPNDEWTEASLVESGTAQQGVLGHYYRSNETDTKDWYKIVVPDEGTATFSTTSETTLRLGNLELYTLNTDGENVGYRCGKDMDGYNKDTTVVYSVNNLAPGTYYIRQSRYGGYGSYDLLYTFTPSSYGQDQFDNESWENASLIANNATQPGRLGHYYRNNETDNYDWFKIEVPDEGVVSISATSEVTLRLGNLEFYTLKTNEDETQTTKYRNGKDMDGYNKDTTVVYDVTDIAPGTYYLKQNRYMGVGSYKLKYVFTPNAHGADAFDNNDFANATTIESGILQQGRLGYYYQTNSTDTKDWYRFEVSCPSEAIFAQTSENTLRLGNLEIYTVKNDEDGTKITQYRNGKDMDGYNKDTTVVLTVGDLAPGIYYVCQNRYGGQGGYAMKFTLVPNSFGRYGYKNEDFASRLTLTEGERLYNTLGYRYQNDTNTADWYDLGVSAGKQIDVTVSPDTTLTLNLSIVELYKYTGDNEKGEPQLSYVKGERMERSQGTLSYIDKDTTTPYHYVVKVNRYSGWGGYSIIYGNEHQGDESLMAENHITIMAEGRNTVRKGVPCENPITVTNMSQEKTGEFLLAVAATDNVDLIGFRMRGRYGSSYLPIDNLTLMDEGEMEHTALLLIPSLNPWESYSFTLISEGKGDIAYAPQETEFSTGRNKIVVNSSTFVVVAAMGYVDDVLLGDKVDQYISNHVAKTFNLDAAEQELYTHHIDLAVRQFDTEKQQEGVGAVGIESLVKRACEGAAEALQTGKIAAQTSNTQKVLESLIPAIRRRLWLWIYKDLAYIQNDIEVFDGKAIITDVVASWDPNEMVGPAGVGEEHYIGQTQTVNYRILFENKAEAGDAAYRVRISDELDESVFDVSTVRFGETSHDGVGYNWEMTREGGKLSWDIKGIELPPNVNAPEGEGYVSFSVDLKPGLPNGTEIKNKATIIFDKNFPIETNEFVNTLDLLPPVTTMAEASYTPGSDHVSVVCNSDDEGSGVESFLLFVSKNGSEYSYFGQSVTGQISYPVVPGTEDTYSFYVLAMDNVGNTEQVVPKAVSVTTDVQGIRIATDPNATLRIYTTDGRYVGNRIAGLPKGVYVIGGKKFIVKD